MHVRISLNKDKGRNTFPTAGACVCCVRVMWARNASAMRDRDVCAGTMMNARNWVQKMPYFWAILRMLQRVRDVCAYRVRHACACACLYVLVECGKKAVKIGLFLSCCHAFGICFFCWGGWPASQCLREFQSNEIIRKQLICHCVSVIVSYWLDVDQNTVNQAVMMIKKSAILSDGPGLRISISCLDADPPPLRGSTIYKYPCGTPKK